MKKTKKGPIFMKHRVFGLIHVSWIRTATYSGCACLWTRWFSRPRPIWQFYWLVQEKVSYT